MARFRDEWAKDRGAQNWERITELVASGRTVEVCHQKVEGEHRLFLRVWIGKRKDGSNKINADPEQEY